MLSFILIRLTGGKSNRWMAITFWLVLHYRYCHCKTIHFQNPENKQREKKTLSLHTFYNDNSISNKRLTNHFQSAHINFFFFISFCLFSCETKIIRFRLFFFMTFFLCYLMPLNYIYTPVIEDFFFFFFFLCWIWFLCWRIGENQMRMDWLYLIVLW